ncbi:MraY family glycosyltransferase [Chlorobium ferrooxidans]|nr:glycosyltransferase [Chlorobium ferrooxidans]
MFDFVFSNPFIPGFVTAILSILLVLTKGWHGKHSCDPIIGIQKFHTGQTPRVGGIAIFCGLLTAWWFSSGKEGQLLGYMLLAGLPAFAAGLIEDVTKKVGVITRLVATMVSGVAAWWLTGYSLSHLHIPGVDTLLLFVPIAVGFTTFAVAGVANATNIIDGFNGLAASTIMIGFSAFSLIAWQVGDFELARLCFVFIAVAGGFLVVNFPFGKIFMGDGGAYLLGFMLAWVAVMLPFRNPTVSVWAPLVACAYPVLETAFSMWRRYHRSGQHPGQADSLHLHSLMYCRVARVVFKDARPQLKNSMTSLFMWPFPLLAALISVFWYSNTPVLMVGFVVCVLCYRLIYLRLTQFVWCIRPATISRD